jgi:hypothetical protein
MDKTFFMQKNPDGFGTASPCLPFLIPNPKHQIPPLLGIVSLYDFNKLQSWLKS